MTDDRLSSIRRAISDPAKVLSKERYDESLTDWQARAVMQAVEPWLAEARADERRACAAELYAAADSLDGGGSLDLVRATLLDCAGMIAPKPPRPQMPQGDYMKQASAPSLRGVDLSRERPGELS